MKTILNILVIFILSSSFLFAGKEQEIINYTIDEETLLDVLGSSNVNNFDCQCKDKFPKSTLKATYVNPYKIKFLNGILQLKVQKLDCKNSRMNKDLCEALKSDKYPIIQIELDEAEITSGKLTDPIAWFELNATVTLTITNVCRKVSMMIKGKKLEDGRYNFISSIDLLLTDFNIDPPTAFFGLIKVNNNIKINFNIVTSIK